MRAKIQKISKYAPSIFQGRLDFAGRHRAFSLTSEHPAEHLLFRVLIGAVVLLAFSYVYFVGSTILNVIARKEALAESAHLVTAVSKLEREYFALSQGIGPEDGVRLGLSPVARTLYIHRPGTLSAGGPAEADTANADVELNEI
ncbi:hypothetical protein HYW60_00880 [Candidatus Kaiserbacteria bacterium]|nr:hypothetical protein [Candidatus Kaiserbacteria bacterium]